MDTYVAYGKQAFHTFSIVSPPRSDIVKGDLGKKIRAARKKAEMTQDHLAKKLGLTRPTISQWESGATMPHAAKLDEIARVLNLPKPDLLSELPADNIRGGPEVARYVPEISWVQAGAWTEVADVHVDFTEVPHWPCPIPCSANTFCLRVEGDSMSPTFPRGVLIYVDPEVPVVSGKKVVAWCEETQSATFKQYVEDGGQRYLKALNPSWPTPYVPITTSCRIIGTVVFQGVEV